MRVKVRRSTGPARAIDSRCAASETARSIEPGERKRGYADQERTLIVSQTVYANVPMAASTMT
jgi:hypothetical protein